MADKSSVCTICDECHINRQSTDWCVECEQPLCSECKEFHAVSKPSRNHATMPIRDYQTLAPSISFVSGYCNGHEEKFQIFCQTHDKLGVQSTSIQDIKLKLTRTINTNIRGTFGCDILPDGKLVFCDYNGKRLVVTDTDGEQLFEVPLQNYAIDVTCISDKTVAVTTLSGIYIIDISSRKILKSIARDNSCWGITSVDGSLVYCLQGKGIEMKDVNGKNTTTIVRCDLPCMSYIASYNDKLYYTNHSTNTVTCCDMKGNTIWTLKDETVLRKPYGISVDNDGHVYVVSNECTSVVVLSADGQQSRQVLSMEDGLNDPSTIHYDRNRNELLVTVTKTFGVLFDVSS